MITYQYFGPDELLLSKFDGTIELSEIISFVGFIQSAIAPKKNLYDVRDAELNITVDDLATVISERNKYPKHPDQISVFLLGRPKETVLGTMLINLTKGQFNVHICSTTDKAILILKISFSKAILEDKLNNLDNRY